MNMEQWTDNFGVQFEKDDNGVVSLIDAPHDIKEYSVPDFVTKIGDYAFFECFGLTSVSIPESVVEIGTVHLDIVLNLRAFLFQCRT